MYFMLTLLPIFYIRFYHIHDKIIARLCICDSLLLVVVLISFRVLGNYILCVRLLRSADVSVLRFMMFLIPKYIL